MEKNTPKRTFFLKRIFILCGEIKRPESPFIATYKYILLNVFFTTCIHITHLYKVYWKQLTYIIKFLQSLNSSKIKRLMFYFTFG